MGLLETSGEFEEFKPADLFVAEVEICVVIVISRSLLRFGTFGFLN